MCNDELLGLVNEAKEGDRESINYLSHIYLDRGMKLVKRMNLINSKSVYEDQDYSFVIYRSLINSIKKYEGQINSVEAFIIQRMKRDIRKFFQRLITRKNIECMKTKCHIDFVEEKNEHDPHRHSIAIEKLNIIKDVINKYPEKDKMIFNFLMKGYKFKEISNKLDLKYSYVYKRVGELRQSINQLNNLQ